MGSTPSHDRVKDRFSVLLSQHLRRLVSACLTFLCIACTEIIAHVKELVAIKWHGNAQIRHNGYPIVSNIFSNSSLKYCMVFMENPDLVHAGLQTLCVIFVCVCVVLEIVIILDAHEKCESV